LRFRRLGREWLETGNTRNKPDGTDCGSDGWEETGNTSWEEDPENECNDKEHKEQEYRDYACSNGVCTYNVTETQWLETGNTRNKPDGTDCGSEETGNTSWEEDPENECKEKEHKEQEYRDYACSNGVCTYNVTDTQWLETRERMQG
jgi:predicted secreted protein